MSDNIYDRLDNSDPQDILAYIKECIEKEKTGSSPQDIGSYITVLLPANNPFHLYEINKFPALTKIMDDAPDLEIGNVETTEQAALNEIKRLVVEFEKEIADLQV